MKTKTFSSLAGVVVVLFASCNAFAWGRRGHQVVGETASLIVSGEPDAEFLRGHSFDMGYYANVPDFMWKRPATYAFEKPQHFMDMEIFQREFAKHPEVEKPFELSRKDFEAKFPEIKPEAGRSFWRVREMYARLEGLTQKLKDLGEPSDANRAERQKLQLQWLVNAGTMGHYIGDLSMPLHVSENYDGNLTGQKGIHSYYEEIVVDQLYPEIGCTVHTAAKAQWPAFSKKNRDKSVVELLMQIAEASSKEVPRLIALDKKSKREELAKNAKMYEPMIRRGLVLSSLTLAELYRRQLGWKFDDKQFYSMDGDPEYILPEGAAMKAEDLGKHR